jgi:DNA-binding MarR family transcriptional regulator
MRQEPTYDPNVGILLREPYLAFSTELLRRLVAAGFEDLRPAHLVVFQHIDPAGSRLTELAARAQMAKPSMQYLLDELELRGYLERRPDPSDGRAKLVHLTDRGWAQIRSALSLIGDMERELAGRLGERRWRTLRRDLTALNAVTAEWVDR